MDEFEKKAREILDTLAKEHGDETFVSSAYAYYEDAVKAFSKMLREAKAEERLK